MVEQKWQTSTRLLIKNEFSSTWENVCTLRNTCVRLGASIIFIVGFTMFAFFDDFVCFELSRSPFLWPRAFYLMKKAQLFLYHN